MRKLFGGLTGGLIGVGLIASTVFATVAFNPADGTGFIGRGDVIGTSGLGKAALVMNPTVTYVDEVVYQQTCTKEIEQKRETKVVTHTFKRERSMNAEVIVDTRVNRGNGNITGYNLRGYVDGSELGGGSVPTNLCPAEPSDWVPAGPVELVSASGGALYYDADGAGSAWNPVAIWWAE